MDVGLCDMSTPPRASQPTQLGSVRSDVSTAVLRSENTLVDSEPPAAAPLRSEVPSSVAAAVNHALWLGLGTADPAKHRYCSVYPARVGALTCESDYPLLGYWADGALQWLCEAQNEVMGVLVKRDQLPAFLQDKNCQVLERIICEIPTTPDMDSSAVHDFLMTDIYLQTRAENASASKHRASIAAAVGLSTNVSSITRDEDYKRIWGGVSGNGVGATRAEVFGVQHTIVTNNFD